MESNNISYDNYINNSASKSGDSENEEDYNE